MSVWILKSALQRIIGWLPNGYWWNGLFQKYITRGYYPSRETFEAKLGYCKRHFSHYLTFSPGARSGFTALELGTGPWPIVPIGLYLCGASEIWTYDLVPVLRRDTLGRTLEFFFELHRDGVLERILSTADPERLMHMESAVKGCGKASPHRVLEELGIHARVGDARDTMLPEGSVDLVFSTVVLEHIRREVLLDLLNEFRRVVSHEGVMSHYIGLADQYASFDKVITPYNFLKYTDRQWSFYDNSIIPQSRLRITDYRELFRQSGWSIVEEHNTVGSQSDLAGIRLSTRFSRYTTEDLLVLFSWLVARPHPEDCLRQHARDSQESADFME
jgi:hypothetical protein